jgi:hypothetical protein
LIEGIEMQDVNNLPPAELVYNEDGVDLSLIRWMLSLTPRERLDVLQGFNDSTWEILHGQGATRVQDGAQDLGGTRG